MANELGNGANMHDDIPNGARVAVYFPLFDSWARGCRVVGSMPGGYLIDEGVGEAPAYYHASRVALYPEGH